MKIDKTQRTYLSDRVRTMFRQAISVLDDRQIARRVTIENEVLKKAGFDKIKAEARKIQEQAEAVSAKYYGLFGFNIVSVSISDFNLTNNQYMKAWLQRQAENILGETPEGILKKKLYGLQQDALDRISLSTMEGEDPFTVLDSVKDQIAGVLGQKALGPGKSE